MYRDDLEALQARLRTLEAELEAERERRRAAEAVTRAAEAAADELRLARRRGDGADGRDMALWWRRHAAVMLILPLALLAVGMMLRAHSVDSDCAWRRYQRYRAWATAHGAASLDPLDHGVERITTRRRLVDAHVRAMLATAQARVASCANRPSPGPSSRVVAIPVRVAIQRGVPVAVDVGGTLRGTAAGSCIERELAQLRFRFVADAFVTTHTYVLN